MIPVQTSKDIAKAAAKRTKKPASGNTTLGKDADGKDGNEEEPSALGDPGSVKRGSRHGSPNGPKYVRFADVLPPCPPKGEFDVNKIRASQYFFS